MAPARVVEAVDVFKYCKFDIPTRVPGISPDQLGLEGFEAAFDSRVVKAISLTVH